MSNYIFFVIFASIFGTGISILQYNLSFSSFISVFMIAIGGAGMIMTLGGVIKEIKYGKEIAPYTPCRKCIWAEPVYEKQKIKGYMCKKIPFNPILMGLYDNHSDRKYRSKRAR